MISVPLREHRLTWRGSPNIGVAGSWDPDVLDFAVHEASGRREDATEMSHTQRYGAFFYVAPRENWGTRIGHQADVPGAVIQDPDDGEAAVVWTYKVGDTEPLTLDYGSFESEEDLAAARNHLLGSIGLVREGNVAGHPHYDPLVTYSPTDLIGFRSRYNTEWGREEVRITVGYTNSDGTLVTGSADYGSVRDGKWITVDPAQEMLPVSPKPGGANFEVWAVELDPIWNDDLGSAVVTFANGPRTYVLSVGTRVRSEVALTW